MKKVTHCRACGSSALTPAFSVDAGVRKSGRRRVFSNDRTNETSYVLCDSSKDAFACGLVQRSTHIDIDEPGVPSGVYRSNRSHLRTIATEALEMISGRDCRALDIGCSDGTLLSFYPRWVDRYGVDAGASVDDIGRWAKGVRASFPSAEFDREIGDTKFDIVSAVSVFEEIDEPRAFLARVKSMLAGDGVFALETLYAPFVLTRTQIESVHERKTALYSLGVLERLFRDCELKIFRGSLTDKAGGSVRLYATHADVDAYDFDPWYERLANLWDEENALALRALAPYQAFEQRAAESKEAFASLMARVKKRGETVHLIGDGTAAAELFMWAGQSASVIEAAVTHRTDLEAAQLCRSGPPVVSEAASRAVEPDYYVAPASLKRELLERWRDPIMRGAKMVFVSPYLHEVHAGNFAVEFGKSLAGGDSGGEVETLRTILRAAGGPRLVVDADRAASA